MATGIDLSGITLEAVLVDDIKDFIIERVFERPEFQAIHGRFETGINVKEQIVFASQYSKTGLKKVAACTRQTSSPESTLTEKFWDPAGIEDTLIVCAAELNGLFKAYFSKIQNYRELYDITGSDLEIFYAILLENSMVATIWRAAWFGDTGVAIASDVTATIVGTTNTNLTVNAVAAGAAGNGISLEIDSITATPADITVVGDVIVASLASGALDVTDLAALIAGSAAAAALITVAGTGNLAVEAAIVTAGGTDTPGLASAADVKFYDYFEGLWEQIFAGVTATTIKRVTITENAILTSKAAQLTLAAGASVAYFKSVKQVSDSRLRSDPDAQLLVSRELYDNYVEYLEDKGVVYDINIVQDGLQSVKWSGYDVVNMETVWDLSSREDFENNTDGISYYLPHRIVFTVPNNIPLGTLNENDFDELEQWYNQDDRVNKTAYGFTEDAKLLEEYMTTVAY